MSTSPRYVASLSNVLEVSLLGDAELAFWKAYLSGTDLAPVESEGRARVHVSASAAR